MFLQRYISSLNLTVIGKKMNTTTNQNDFM
jgi:hypothetical protein